MGNNYTYLDNISSPAAALGPGSALVPSFSGLLLPSAADGLEQVCVMLCPGWTLSLAPPARQAGEAEPHRDVWEEAEERKIRHIY